MENWLYIVVLITAAPFLLFSMVARGGMNFGHMPFSMRVTTGLVVTIALALSLVSAFALYREPSPPWAIPLGWAAICVNVLVLVLAGLKALSDKGKPSESKPK